MRHETEEERWSYNLEDCVRTREVGEAETATIVHLGLQDVESFQQSMFYPVLEAMNRGIRFDESQRGKFAGVLQEELSKRDEWFAQVLGHPLNPRSPQQLQTLFYSDLNLPPIKNRKTGNLTTDWDALLTLSTKEPLVRPLVKKILEYRSLGVFLSTFVLAPLDEDGRMRCSYNICGTETYRLSSSENAFGSGTNLQNLPKGGEEEGFDLDLPNVRSLFLPDPGFTFFDTDLSKADLRIVVWEADEREMKAMLAEGRDPYIETAREFYHDPSISKYKADGSENSKYRTFKSFAHGSHYLGSPKGIAMNLGLTVHEVEKTQTWYFGKYPKIRAWQEALKTQVSRHHFVENKFGYRRHYFDRITPDVFKQAAAWIPQSSIGILINKIWRNIYRNLREVQVLLQTHDALSGQFPTHLKDWCLARMLEESRVVIPYDDPLIIPTGIKTSPVSWGDCA